MIMKQCGIGVDIGLSLGLAFWDNSRLLFLLLGFFWFTTATAATATCAAASTSTSTSASAWAGFTLRSSMLITERSWEHVQYSLIVLCDGCYDIVIEWWLQTSLQDFENDFVDLFYFSLCLSLWFCPFVCLFLWIKMRDFNFVLFVLRGLLWQLLNNTIITASTINSTKHTYLLISHLLFVLFVLFVCVVCLCCLFVLFVCVVCLCCLFVLFVCVVCLVLFVLFVWLFIEVWIKRNILNKPWYLQQPTNNTNKQKQTTNNKQQTTKT